MTDREQVTVLFVDDEPSVLSALRRALSDEPYGVRICEDPRQALEEIVRDAPAVVVADFYMPQMRGPELLARVREIDSSIVRMVLTGKPDVTAVLDAVREGAIYRFLLKPWDEGELRMSIHQAIEHNRILSERAHLIAKVDRQRQTLESLEKSHPGISKLPGRDASGAYVLTPDDLPKERS